MPLDPSIFNALGRGKTAFEWQQDYEDRDNKRAMLDLQRQSMGMEQQRNALALDSARRQAADDAALRSYMAGAPDLSKPEAVSGLYSAAPSAAGGVLKTYNEGVKAQREAKQAETGQKLNEQKLSDAQWESRMKKHQQAILDISGMTNADEALANLQKHVQAGDIDFAKASMIANTLQQTRGNDAAFRQWRSQTITGLMDAKDRAMAERQAQNDASVIANRPLIPGQNGFVPNVQLQDFEIKKAAAGAAQVPGMTYMTDAQGNIVGLPTKAPLGKTVVANVVKDAGGAALPGKDAGLNDSQSKALLFGARMQEADKILADMASQGVTQPSMTKRVAEAVPLVGGALGMAANAAASPQQQKVEQAQRDFINAVLRRESGAAISPGEFDSAAKQYFAQPGDKPQVMEQKARNRALAIQGLLAEVPQGKRQLPGAGQIGNTPTSSRIGQEPKVVDFSTLK